MRTAPYPDHPSIPKILMQTNTYPSSGVPGVRPYQRRYNRRVIATARPRRRLLLASNNAHKLAEYRALFAGLPFVLQVPEDLGLTLDVAETGRTFTENAVLKARAFARAAGVAALADDSGLEVDALGGLPGTRSRRYAGEDATDAERMALLLERLRGVATAERTARFRCVIAVAAADGSLLGSVEGVVEGLIAAEPRGTHGFGYDPVFRLPERGCTMAELSPEEKNAISHRAQAAAAARDLLAAWRG